MTFLAWIDGDRRFRDCAATLIIVVILLAVGCSRSSSSDTSTPTVSVALSATTIATQRPTEILPTASTTSTARTPTLAAPTPTLVPTATNTPQFTPTATPDPSALPTHQVTVAGHDITLPATLTIDVFAEGLGSPRMMALRDDGTLFVTDSDGRILMLPDEDGDGRADDAVVIASGLNTPTGIVFHDGQLYVAETTRVSRVVDEDGDGTSETLDPVVDGLPDGGHSTRTIRFGPDGLLYVSIGSSCNVCIEDDPRRAAIVRYQPDGSAEELFATGLRNAVGITFDPVSGALWATNNGRDGMGDDIPPETVNIVTQGADFGWPRCHAGIIVDPDFGGDMGCSGVAPPAVIMQAHSAPLGLTFTSGSQLGPDWDGALFVAFHGSWDRTVPTGFKVVAIPLVNGVPTGAVLDFATGWLLPDGNRWGRPVDVIQAANGSLLVSDDWGGRIFRIHPVS